MARRAGHFVIRLNIFYSKAADVMWLSRRVISYLMTPFLRMMLP